MWLCLSGESSPNAFSFWYKETNSKGLKVLSSLEIKNNGLGLHEHSGVNAALAREPTAVPQAPGDARGGAPAPRPKRPLAAAPPAGGSALTAPLGLPTSRFKAQAFRQMSSQKSDCSS